jgi:glycosyltransferase involved in cell wall biosynthesis
MKPKVVIVMPAYNAARTIERTVAALPADVVDEVIVVDDASRDSTVSLARRLGLQVIAHSRNLGYGMNQKTCYSTALRRGAEIVVMVHADHQYDPTFIQALIAPLMEGRADVMLGSRIVSGQALAGGMPLWKYLANRFLTFLENLVLGQQLTDLHTGFRAYHRDFLEHVPWFMNSNDFVFDTQMIVQAVACGYVLGETSIPARYFPEASSVGFRASLRYGIQTLGVLGAYLLHRTGLYPSRQFQRAAATEWQSNIPSEIVDARPGAAADDIRSSDGELQ